MIAVGFTILHLCVCAGVGIMIKSGKLQTRSLIFPAVLCIPVWGVLLLVVELYELRRKQMGTKQIGLDSLKIVDVKYQRIKVDDSQNQEITVPLEEAILVNEAPVRRRLIMDILHKDPEQYIELLQKTRTAEDTELTHYATTTMMEIQGKYEAQIHAYKEDVDRRPENLNALRRYQRVLKKYIDSGLITGTILDIYRNQLEEAEQLLLKQDPKNRKYHLESIENRIAMNRMEGVEQELTELLKQWPKEAQVYRVFVEYYWNMHKADKIQQLLSQMKKEEVYLTHEEKQWYEFWNTKGSLV